MYFYLTTEKVWMDLTLGRHSQITCHLSYKVHNYVRGPATLCGWSHWWGRTLSATANLPPCTVAGSARFGSAGDGHFFEMTQLRDPPRIWNLKQYTHFHPYSPSFSFQNHGVTPFYHTNPITFHLPNSKIVGFLTIFTSLSRWCRIVPEVLHNSSKDIRIRSVIIMCCDDLSDLIWFWIWK